MATIARLVVELSAKTAEFQRAMDDVQRVSRDTQRAMEVGAQAVRLLEDRLDTLRIAFRTGQISEAQFASGLRTLQADLAETANKAQLTDRAMADLAKVGQRVAGDLNRVTAIAKRSASGFEAFGIATLAASQVAGRGIAGIGAAAGALGVFARGNPVLIGILGGLAALAGAWDLIKRATDGAKASADGWLATVNAVAQLQQQGRAQLGVSLLTLRGERFLLEREISARGTGPSSEQAARLAEIQRLMAQIQEAQRTIGPFFHATNQSLGQQVASHQTINNELKKRIDLLARLAAAEVANALRAGEHAAFLAQRNQGIVGQMTQQLHDRSQRVDINASGAGFGAEIASVEKQMRLVREMLQVRTDILDLTSAIGSAVSAMASQLGTALAQGANFFAAFAESAIAAIGSLIQAIGQMLIAKGIGDIVRSLPFAGPLAIGIGAGLVALGAAMGGRNPGGRGPSGVGGVGEAHADRGTRPANQPVMVTVEINGQPVPALVRSMNREEALGGSSIGVRHRVAVPGVMVVSPVVQRG